VRIRSILAAAHRRGDQRFGGAGGAFFVSAGFAGGGVGDLVGPGGGVCGLAGAFGSGFGLFGLFMALCSRDEAESPWNILGRPTAIRRKCKGRAAPSSCGFHRSETRVQQGIGTEPPILFGRRIPIRPSACARGFPATGVVLRRKTGR
jgi:hypothetical protein